MLICKRQNGLFELAALRSRTRKANNVMKIRNPGPNWALHMVKRLVGTQKFITDGTKAEGPATALGRRPKNGGELA